MSKLQSDFEKCGEIQTASSWLFIKLKNTLSISEHSFEWRVAKHCMSLIVLLIVGDCVSTGYINW